MPPRPLRRRDDDTRRSHRPRPPRPLGLLAGVVAALALGLGLSACGGSSSSTSGTTTGETTGATTTTAANGPMLAPAFTAEQLAADPGADWITNGGSLSNQRYSPLDEITTDNVKDLKGVWHVNLDGSGTDAKYSQEGQPIAYNGVLYVTTGADDVFAVRASDGKRLWTTKAGLDDKIDTACCGWDNRGVAIGDDRVYLGRLDGKLQALSMEDGKVLWTTQVARWQDGYTITSAPLYVDGMVITGVSGGEFGIRGRVTAFDARTGKERWRFYTTAAPGEVGGDSWGGTKAWQTGGAPVWQTPAVDPELGLIYFSTGNAAPDLDGSKRPGDNLFTASIVALDLKTGKHRWHFQTVHHDIWDYDMPSPVVLFDLEKDGSTVHGLGEASKTGWLYLLDRTNGKPLYGITEKAVPQDAKQKTAKTQPFPDTPPFIPHEVSDAEFEQVSKLVEKSTVKGLPSKVTRMQGMFEPFGDEVRVITPGPAGGTNWPPSSYNPKTQMFYVCASRNVAGYSFTKHAPYKKGEVYIGSILSLAGFGASPGTFAAIDATSGKIAWTKEWPDACYSGSTTTGGNLVFVGRSSGVLEAYDARDGTRLWGFQTGAGANSTATVFQDGGKQRIAFLAGGNALVASPHGDELWVLGLDGKLGPAKAPGEGQGTGHAGEGPAVTNEKGDAGKGQEVFAANCSGCHGLAGKGGNGGPDLSSRPDAKNLTKVLNQIRNGGGGMPPFKDNLSAEQIRDVAAYVTQKVAGS